MQLLILKDDLGSQREKGDIVEIRATSTPTQIGDEATYFVWVDVPSVPIKDFKQYNELWRLDIDFEVVNSNISVDGFSIRVFAVTVNSVNRGALSKDDIEEYIEEWGGTVFSFGTNEVIFDILISDAIVANRFWRAWKTDVLSLVDFTELSYDSGTGLHRLQIDYSAVGNNPTFIM